MKCYVLSWNSGATIPSALDGVYGVFSTIEKAQYAVFEYIAAWNDTLLDTDTDITMQLFFTAQGTWEIERYQMDDAGL